MLSANTINKNNLQETNMATNKEMTLLSWEESIRQQFADKDITFRNDDNNIMAFMVRSINTNILVGRYDKFNHRGRIFDSDTTNFDAKLS